MKFLFGIIVSCVAGFLALYWWVRRPSEPPHETISAQWRDEQLRGRRGE